MARTAEDDQKLVAELGHFKKLRKVAELLSFLHKAGCERDKAGNRQLHYDDYVLLVLLWMFNPMIDSMRTLLRISALPQVQKKLGIRRCSLGSFSESCRVFDPSMLQQVIEQLAKDLHPVGRQELFKDLPGVLTLVDGTLLRTLRSVVEAMWLPGTDGKHEHRTHAWKLHLHFDVDHHVPTRWELTNARGEGRSEERDVLLKRLKADHTYVMDRGYSKFTLFNEINGINSAYVCRVRDNSVYEVVQDRALSPQDVQAGVISDQIVRMGIASQAAARPDHLMRLVCVKTTPHAKRGKTAGGTSGPPSADGVLRIVANLLDPPAQIIASLYKYRWTLEVFIRFLKQVLGCRHLLSTKREGIEIQISAAIICCMLINLLTGRKPDKWMLNLMSLYLAGWASEQDVLNELNRPDNTGIKTRAKDELWKKLGY